MHQVLGENGLLAQSSTSYRPRADQLQMAQAVTQAIASNSAVVIEAGTGVGKTFAYLVPALLSGERIAISTATKNLQDQLFARDLPYLCQLLGLPLRMALLKGRGSYLCLQRLANARQHPDVHGGMLLRTLAKIEKFAQSTSNGDLGELDGLDERSPVLPLVTSTRENCLGSQCPEFKNCYVNQARRAALAADVVVINHHLFFADLAVRESGMAELLPSVHTVIFDEAHQLNAIGVQFLGQQLTTGHLLDYSRDLLACGLQHARGLEDWSTLAQKTEQAARDLRLLAAHLAHGKYRWQGSVPDGIAPEQWASALQNLQQHIASSHDALHTVSELSPDFARLQERASALQGRITLFSQPQPPDTVRWMDVGNSLRLAQSPLDIAATMQHTLMGNPAQSTAPTLPQDEQEEAEHTPAAPPRRAWVFTSATLGEDPHLRWFTEPCGLQHATTLQVASPFAYAQNAGLYIADIVPPSDPKHAQQVAHLAAETAALLGGRTLVLTTTLRNLRLIGEQLREHFAGDQRIEVLIQGESTKRRLTERFRQGDNGGKLPGCILVASASFWEGVDIPGDALQQVIIDKLPFPPPNDPMVEAHAQRLQQQGKNPFTHYHLPEAAVALKQGAGRLIRHENDRGVLIICDSRLLKMGYGRRLLAVLPPMQRLPNHAALLQKIEQINQARASVV
ncbi:MAG: ATP-dependent DNA helicase [Brachymonas sp.]|nr:ATP-dependent DNA helicase [Brachymonas sp.]MBP6138432.1 ATP-dependent DNA helicase [Brachymonas sp.]MBP6966109.1 ATP-dependent DNA helicase [Brachymonas sp.]MBP7246934.1 ATP-dependent DNA helicase [Brachymonas sp.]MBP7740024.1 ATP-dependent DNA helicase [Brachymonas sp.]